MKKERRKQIREMGYDEYEAYLKKRRQGRWITLISVLLALVIIAGSFAISNTVYLDKNIEFAQSFSKVEYIRAPQLAPATDNDGYYTFTTNRDFKVLQFTDVHIGGGFGSVSRDRKALNAVAAMIRYEQPDLVVVTGDLSYPVPFQAGTFNNLSAAKQFASLMETLGVYWTICFGNHDTEVYSYYNREELSEFYSGDEYPHCLFQAGPESVDGYGNQIIKVKNSEGIVTNAFVMMDSHSYVEGAMLGISWDYDNLKQTQADWYKAELEEISRTNKAIKADAAPLHAKAFFHIPVKEYRTAWFAYVENGYKDTADVKLIYGGAHEDPEKKVVYCGEGEEQMFETMLALNEIGDVITDGMYVGHDHYNNLSMMYKGIRLTYGYSIDYLAYGSIVNEGAQRGVTVILCGADGSYTSVGENYYQDKYVSDYEKEVPETMEYKY